jgi:O-antigen ligase
MSASPSALRARNFAALNAPDDELPVSPELARRLLLVTGILWGSITAFSFASEDYGPQLQGLGLGVGLVFGLVALGISVLLAWARFIPGLLLTLHVLVACVSGFLMDSELQNIARYVALVPAFAMFLAAAQFGQAESLRTGLTCAGLGFVFFHLCFLEFDSLFDAGYRLTVFLNPNGTGFIAVMTAISSVSLAMSEPRRAGVRALWLLGAFCCVVIWFSTKSRTALLALLAGMATFGLLRYQNRRARWAIAFGLLLVLGLIARRMDFLVDTLSIEDRDRSIQTATGRYEIWNYVLTEIFPTGPFLGVGPGEHMDMVFEATGSTNAHNGLLMALSETGLLGTLPLVGLLGLCGAAIIRHRRQPEIIWAAALFVAGATESMGEVLFFSMGSPGSLLFMLAAACLTIWKFPETSPPEPEPALPSSRCTPCA